MKHKWDVSGIRRLVHGKKPMLPLSMYWGRGGGGTENKIKITRVRSKHPTQHRTWSDRLFATSVFVSGYFVFYKREKNVADNFVIFSSPVPPFPSLPQGITKGNVPSFSG